MELTSGRSGVFLLPEGWCCPKGEPNSDTILVYVRKPPLGTLRKMVIGVLGQPKGVTPFRGATVFVARVNKDGLPRLARPCSDCWEKLTRWGVKEVVYTTEDGWKRERV